MNASRTGHDLKIQIRLALSRLGRPTDVNLSKLTIAELKAMRSDLHAECDALTSEKVVARLQEKIGPA